MCSKVPCSPGAYRRVGCGLDGRPARTQLMPDPLGGNQREHAPYFLSSHCSGALLRLRHPAWVRTGQRRRGVVINV